MNRCMVLTRCSILLLSSFTGLLAPLAWGAEEKPAAARKTSVPALREAPIVSSVDGTKQPCLVWAPESAKGESRPLLLFLHSWSGDYKQDNSAWQAEAVGRQWIYIHPHFRGPNFGPDAGGSALAQQDILDALDWAIGEYKVDADRIYLAGGSGGGHMSLLMAGRHPNRFSAVSAWCPITDLTEWYRFHAKPGVVGRYAENIVSVCGGAPGSSEEIDKQYRDRSPITWLAAVGDLPIDINAGVHDGHTGSVPVAHSLRAFNVIAAANRSPLITEREMDELWTQKKLSNPQPQDILPDSTYVATEATPAAAIYLRRHAGATRVTIFDGGHIALSTPACQWLEKQSRPTKRTP